MKDRELPGIIMNIPIIQHKIILGQDRGQKIFMGLILIPMGAQLSMKTLTGLQTHIILLKNMQMKLMAWTCILVI